MKKLLSRPGCLGGWSSFLDSQRISRTTADHLAAAHAKSVGLGENGTTGAIHELTEEEVAELAKAIWKKLEKKLGTKRAVYVFLGRLAAESGLANFKFSRGEKRGLAIVNPDDNSSQPPTSESETSPVPTDCAE